MNENSKPVIVLFRKDLRLADNLALNAAANLQVPVIPVYIKETAADTGPLGGAQDWWLHHSLLSLQHALDRLGSTLVLRKGDQLDTAIELIRQTGANTVYWNRRYDPQGIKIDSAMKLALQEQGITTRSFAGTLLHEPTKLLTGGGTPYKVYTPFWKAFEASGPLPGPLPAPDNLIPPMDLASDSLDDWNLLPKNPDWASQFGAVWKPGETGASEKLADFCEHAVHGYKELRNNPAGTTTSLLSPHLALGEISPLQIWHATRPLFDSAPAEDVTHFRKELVWREFSWHLLFHFPKIQTDNLNPRFDAFPWRDAPEQLAAWKKGMTGYPIVDAGMRQLWTHGWMHNRVRMIVASFLIKHLGIDWREGERWFRDTLVDADAASNAASWQWVAGCGADAAPYYRIFNPILQGTKFDPDGTYVRQFVPELAELSHEFIHRPFDAPRHMLKDAHIELGVTYPKPLVDHAIARDRAMQAYQTIKDAA